MRILALSFLFLVGACASTGETGVARGDATAAPEMEAVDVARLTWARLDRLNWPEPQDVRLGYSDDVRDALWGLYSSGGTELYCRYEFFEEEADARAIAYESRRILITWEHVYPADSIADGLGFEDRDCQEPRNEEAEAEVCRGAIADLYNLFPAFGPINSSRSNHAFSELPGEGTNSDNFPYCADFERTYGASPTYVEPTELARGDIARAILYMHYVYGLPFDRVIDDRNRLLDWANSDPVDEEELWREENIRALQPGSYNPLVASAGAQS